MEVNGVVFRLSEHAAKRFRSRFGSENVSESFRRAVPVTTRDKTFPMAGFPASRLEYYVGQLTRAGHRVAVCEPENAK